MTKVFKYRIALEDVNAENFAVVEMPIGSVPFSVVVLRERLAVYAVVDPENEVERRRFCVSGTGDDINPSPHWQFLGTVLFGDHLFVYHVWDTKEIAP